MSPIGDLERDLELEDFMASALRRRDKVPGLKKGRGLLAVQERRSGQLKLISAC